MSCKKNYLKLSPFIDDELSEKEEKELKKHLQICTKCSCDYHSLKEIDLIFQKTHLQLPESDFVNNVISKVDAIKPSRFFIIKKVASVLLVFLPSLVLGGAIVYSLGNNFNNAGFNNPPNLEKTSGLHLADNHLKKPSAILKAEAEAEVESNKKQFPYKIKLEKTSDGYFVLINNKEEEKQWQEFMADYKEQYNDDENLNHYQIQEILTSSSNYGEF